MNEFYLEIRLVHLYAVAASGGLFFVRGLMLFSPLSWPPKRWAIAAPLRYLGYSIDTVLLTAAFMLMTITQQYPFAHAWLTVKVVLLVLYIALGYQAFKDYRTHQHHHSQTRGVYLWLTAFVVYLLIVSVARAHRPLGIFSQWL